MNKITKKLTGNLYIKGNNVVTDADFQLLRHVNMPFTDFPIEENSIVKISNYTINNIICTYKNVYGSIVDKTYELYVIIPKTVDLDPGNDFHFNEFYINFILETDSKKIDNIKLKLHFCLDEGNEELQDNISNIIAQLEYTIDVNHTYHFYENASGNYTVSKGRNLAGIKKAIEV